MSRMEHLRYLSSHKACNIMLVKTAVGNVEEGRNVSQRARGVVGGVGGGGVGLIGMEE